MEDFLTSERFEQMAREYNAKYRQANVLEKLFDKNGEKAKTNLDDVEGLNCENKWSTEQKLKVADVLLQMMSLVKICEGKMPKNLRFFGKNNMGEKLLEKIHKTALDNDISLEKGQNGQFFLRNDKNFVLKLIEIEKIFAKDEEIAKVQCLCDIHKMFLDYMSDFCERI